jgi:hypothetical protein
MLAVETPSTITDTTSRAEIKFIVAKERLSYLSCPDRHAIAHAFRDNAGRLEISAEVSHRGYFA